MSKGLWLGLRTSDDDAATTLRWWIAIRQSNATRYCLGAALSSRLHSVCSFLIFFLCVCVCVCVFIISVWLWSVGIGGRLRSSSVANRRTNHDGVVVEVQMQKYNMKRFVDQHVLHEITCVVVFCFLMMKFRWAGGVKVFWKTASLVTPTSLVKWVKL